jgi:hypothetical protein
MSDIIFLTAVTGGLTLGIVCIYVVCSQAIQVVRFRRYFAEEGITWSDACAAVDSGRGYLVLDHVLASSKGLPDPVVWWLPCAPSDAGYSLSNSCPWKAD